MRRRKEIIGKRYGNLLILKEISIVNKVQKYYLCKCDCGNQTIVRYSNIVDCVTSSCGCNRGLNLTGKRFGRLIVDKLLKERKKGQKQYLCKCDCGNEIILISSKLRSGNTKSCGCLIYDRRF